MSRTGRTPIDDNAVYGDLDKSEREVILGQFLTIYSHISKMVTSVCSISCEQLQTACWLILRMWCGETVNRNEV